MYMWYWMENHYHSILFSEFALNKMHSLLSEKKTFLHNTYLWGVYLCGLQYREFLFHFHMWSCVASLLRFCATGGWEAKNRAFARDRICRTFEIKTVKLSDLKPYQCIVLLNFFASTFFGFELNILIEWKQRHRYFNWCRVLFRFLHFFTRAIH